MMLGLVAESVANDGCCEATCCEAASKCRFVCISTIDSFYRQKDCKRSFRDHLSIETACSDVIRMQNLSGIHVDIYIYIVLEIFEEKEKMEYNLF